MRGGKERLIRWEVSEVQMRQEAVQTKVQAVEVERSGPGEGLLSRWGCWALATNSLEAGEERER